jgi:hypothetical protein
MGKGPLRDYDQLEPPVVGVVVGGAVVGVVVGAAVLAVVVGAVVVGPEVVGTPVVGAVVGPAAAVVGAASEGVAVGWTTKKPFSPCPEASPALVSDLKRYRGIL